MNLQIAMKFCRVRRLVELELEVMSGIDNRMRPRALTVLR